MIGKRQSAINNISQTLAIMRCDIEQRQSVSDYSLNIHGENYFRDIFNFIYDCHFENANFETSNSACIDLIDKKNKKAYQITTTRSAEKMHNTFKALTTKEFKGYKIKILYLLEKAKPNKNTQDEFKKDYGINLIETLIDYTDLISDINNLEHNKLIELNERYFKSVSVQYTNTMVLNIIFKKLIAQHQTINKDYDDDLGNIETNEKFIINELNDRTKGKINEGLDYVPLLYDDDNLIIDDLREFVIGDLYKKSLVEVLSSKIHSSKIIGKNLDELHLLAIEHKLNFNKIIHKLYDKIKQHIDIEDWNSMSIIWIIIAFFFEICDVGIKNDFTE